MHTVDIVRCLRQHRIVTRHQDLARLGRNLPAEYRLHDRVHLLRARLGAKRVELRKIARAGAGDLPGGETQSKVDAVENGAGVHPRVAAIGPTIRSLAAEDRLTECRRQLRRARRRVGLGVHGAQRAGDELEGRFHLRAIGGAAEELRTRDDAMNGFSNVSIGLRERLRAPVDQRFGRFVTHEVARELHRDEARRGRMTGDDVEHALAFVLSVAGREFLAENHLLAGVVDIRVEEELAGLPLERPSGQRTRYFLDVLLRVPAVDAERMKLHQLASIVLVETAARPLLQLLHQTLALFRCRVLETLASCRRKLTHLTGETNSAGTTRDDAGSSITAAARRRESRLSAVRSALPVVEKEEHRRTLRDRPKQVAELTQSVRTNHVAIVLR